MIVLVYVEDTIVTSGDTKARIETKRELLKCFEGSDEGKLTWYIGVRMQHAESSLTFSQNTCLDALLRDKKLENTRMFNTPMEGNFHEENLAYQGDEIKQKERYSKLVGSLLYLSNRTRPEICFATSILAQHMAKPNDFLMSAANRVAGYLLKTSSFGLEFSKNCSTVRLEFFCRC